MMLNPENIEWLMGKGFVVQPPRTKEKLPSLEDFAQNEFIYLEDNRFLGTKFIKFPDEKRQVSYQNEAYEIFGKSCWDFFAIGSENKGIYLISSQEESPLIYQINENLGNFIKIYS